MRKTFRLLLASLTLLATALIGQDKASVNANPSQATSPPDPIRLLHELHKRAYEACPGGRRSVQNVMYWQRGTSRKLVQSSKQHERMIWVPER
jgi:aminoglycoside phosphotransferase